MTVTNVAAWSLSAGELSAAGLRLVGVFIYSCVIDRSFARRRAKPRRSAGALCNVGQCTVQLA